MQQEITPDLRAWIQSRVAAGETSAQLLLGMRASGWDEAVAAQALNEVLDRPAGELALATGRVALPELVPVQGSVVRALDRDVTVQVQVQHPRVVVLADLLSKDECKALIEAARPRLARSETVANHTGGSEVNAARTSQGMFFAREENELCARLEHRIAALFQWPLDHGEGLQVLRYGAGAEYRPHHDYFDPVQPGTPAILARGGQRLATLVMYLNTPEGGGATTFPEAGLTVHAVAGSAVFFSYALPSAATRTLHGGAPVSLGEKWVATKWLRAGRFT